MTSALEVPTWPNPVGTNAITDVYAIVTGFKIDVEQQRYAIEVSVFLDQAAFQAGKLPITTLIYRSRQGSQTEGWDGVFPNWAGAFADTAFQVPLISLRDWIFDTLLANDPKFAGSTEL